MHVTTEFWHFFFFSGPLFAVCGGWCGGGGASLSLPPLRVVSSLRSCALGVSAARGVGGAAPVELWMEVKRG